MKKGSPQDYTAEIGCSKQSTQKSRLGEPHECYSLYREFSRQNLVVRRDWYFGKQRLLRIECEFTLSSIRNEFSWEPRFCNVSRRCIAFSR